MMDRDVARDETYEGRGLVAAFADRESAHDVAGALRDEGFHNIWTGVTRASDASSTTATAGGTTVEPADDSFGAKLGRFFSGESGETGLYEALVRHGVAQSEARRIDSSLTANSVILTVDGSNHPELAAQIIEDRGGHILAGESFGDDESYGGATAYDTAAERSMDQTDRTTEMPGLRGSQVLGYQNPSEYARGQRLDEEQRIRLREERLNVDKTRVSAGTAEVSTEVVEHQQSIDVPTVREEVFIERRPVTEQTEAGVEPITTGQTIRIPLTREQIAVTKRPVVKEEVVVGKREVTDTQHVSATTREERLVEGGATAGTGVAAADANELRSS
jgi:uncharacterized protein (TIGR02271 family)